MTIQFLSSDIEMMQEALKQAQKAFEKGEVPVGAVLVLNQKIVARAHNLMESMQDPTAHAEVLCIREAAEKLGDWRLLEATLYTTLEPCAMCAGAALLARVKKIVWGAPDLRHGANGSWVDLFSEKHPTHSLEIAGGLCEDEAACLMRQFFTERRQKCT